MMLHSSFTLLPTANFVKNLNKHGNVLKFVAWALKLSALIVPYIIPATESLYVVEFAKVHYLGRFLRSKELLSLCFQRKIEEKTKIICTWNHRNKQNIFHSQTTMEVIKFVSLWCRTILPINKWTPIIKWGIHQCIWTQTATNTCTHHHSNWTTPVIANRTPLKKPWTEKATGFPSKMNRKCQMLNTPNIHRNSAGNSPTTDKSKPNKFQCHLAKRMRKGRWDDHVHPLTWGVLLDKLNTSYLK